MPILYRREIAFSTEFIGKGTYLLYMGKWLDRVQFYLCVSAAAVESMVTWDEDSTLTEFLRKLPQRQAMERLREKYARTGVLILEFSMTCVSLWHSNIPRRFSAVVAPLKQLAWLSLG